MLDSLCLRIKYSASCDWKALQRERNGVHDLASILRRTTISWSTQLEMSSRHNQPSTLSLNKVWTHLSRIQDIVPAPWAYQTRYQVANRETDSDNRNNMLRLRISKAHIEKLRGVYHDQLITAPTSDIWLLSTATSLSGISSASRTVVSPPLRSPLAIT